MSTVHYLPRFDDHFPHTKRGHGSTHPEARFNRQGVKTREANPCCDPTCHLNMPKSANTHRDKAANIQMWREERGL